MGKLRMVETKVSRSLWHSRDEPFPKNKDLINRNNERI